MAKSSFTLDAINEESDREYGATEITLPDGTVVELRNVIRLSKEERKAVKDFKFSDDEEKDEDGNVVESEEKDEEEELGKVVEFLKIIAADNDSVDKLVEAIGPNRPDLLMLIIRKYMEDQKAGKASESES